MGSNKVFLGFLVVFFLLLGSFFTPQLQDTLYSLSVDLGFEEEAKFVKTSFKSTMLLENLSYTFYMCPGSNNLSCENSLEEFISTTQNSLSCAFYELDSFKLVEELNLLVEKGVDISIVVDDNYIGEESLHTLSSKIELSSDSKRNTRYNNYMHHKFCVKDEESVLVSSANPTENGLFYNNNNIFEFQSKEVAKIFLEEFSHLEQEIFGYHKPFTTSVSSFEIINSSIDSFDVFMCPQDSCEGAILNVLERANSSIYFANFVLTLDSVESLLLNKSNSGLNVEGVIESRMWNARGSRAEELSKTFSLVKDSNPKTMHHKFFVVDEYYVVTGSMNPSSSGVNYNDENLLIIGSEEIASSFLKEFETLQ